MEVTSAPTLNGEALSVQPAPSEDTADILADYPMWLYASRHERHMLVYKSVLVPDVDERLEAVNQVLNTHQHRVVCSQVIEDEDMMFGEAIATWYEIKGEV